MRDIESHSFFIFNGNVMVTKRFHIMNKFVFVQYLKWHNHREYFTMFRNYGKKTDSGYCVVYLTNESGSKI